MITCQHEWEIGKIQYMKRLLKEFQKHQMNRILEHNGLFRTINNTINTHD